MRKTASSLFALLVLTLAAAPPAFASESWPPSGWERVTMYYGGECNSTSRTINGYFSVSCADDPYYSGTRSGKWRAITDTSCSSSAANDEYQVCTTGDNCSSSSGTWQTISYQDWEAGNCP